MSKKVPLVCELAEGGEVTFPAPYTEADDYDDTWQLYELFASLIGA